MKKDYSAKRTTLNITHTKAKRKLNDIVDLISNKYGAVASLIKYEYGIGGTTASGPSGDLTITVNSTMGKTGKFFGKVNDFAFLNAVCASFHEEQHLIQTADYYQAREPNDDTCL